MRISLKQLAGNLDIIASSFFLLITVGVVIANVAFRYLLNGGFYWAEEISTTAFIWSVFIGSAAAYRCRMHIGIELFAKFCSPRIANISRIFIDLFMCIINGYIVKYSIVFCMGNSLKKTPVLDIPAIYVNLALTVSFSLITLYSLYFLWQDIALLLQKRSNNIE